MAYVTSIMTGKPMPSVPEVDDLAASPRPGGDDMIFEMEGVGSESKAPTAALTEAEKRLRSASTHVLVHGESVIYFGNLLSIFLSRVQIDTHACACRAKRYIAPWTRLLSFSFPTHRACSQPLPSSSHRLAPLVNS